MFYLDQFILFISHGALQNSVALFDSTNSPCKYDRSCTVLLRSYFLNKLPTVIQIPPSVHGFERG